jgi:hypothetical protein
MLPVLATSAAPVAASIARSVGGATASKAWKAAQDFEAMAIGQFLMPIFNTVDLAHTAFGGGDGEDAWKPMMVQELGKSIAKAGGIGLAAPVYAAMLHAQETRGSAATESTP